MRVSGPDMCRCNRSETFSLKFVSLILNISFLQNFSTYNPGRRIYRQPPFPRYSVGFRAKTQLCNGGNVGFRAKAQLCNEGNVGFRAKTQLCNGGKGRD